MTKRISSVAYAVDEMASDEKTASAIGLRDPLVLLLGVASGRPTRTRLTTDTTRFGTSADGSATPAEARQSGTRRGDLGPARDPER